MSLDWFNQATQKEKEQFKSVCNQLLSRTYVVRTNLQPGKGRINNPDYTFIGKVVKSAAHLLKVLNL